LDKPEIAKGREAEQAGAEKKGRKISIELVHVHRRKKIPFRWY